MTDPDLFLVLDRATDAIRPDEESHHAAASALARARVVRTRRKGLLAGAVAAAAVLAVVVGTGIPGADRSEHPAGPTPTVPPVPGSVVQATWDPRDAAELPRRTSVLPPTIERPSEPVELPLSGPARLVLTDGEGRLHLLATDGRWGWTQAPSGSADVASLSNDGTMLANIGDGRLFVTDVRHGGYEWRELELPADLALPFSGLDVRLQWRGNTHLAVSSLSGGVAVLEVAAPAAEPEVVALDLAGVHGFTEAPDGTGLAFGNGRGGRVVREVEDGEVTSTFGAEALENVWLPIATDRLVAGVVSGLPQADRPTRHGGVLVLDRDGYSAVAYLPIAGTTYRPGVDASGFGAGGVSPVAWIDDRTLMLGTGSDSFGRPWSLVAWDVDSGDLSLLSRGGAGLRLLGVAPDLVDE